MERFDDLMGITHSTGDAFLDKKLNQNTCNILGMIAAGAALGALNKPKAPKVAGGGIDPFLQPYYEPALKRLQGQLGYAKQRAMPAEERIAARTIPELQAESSLLALSGADPDYLSTLTGQLGERLARAEGIGEVNLQDIIARREAFKPLFAAEELEARQQFESTLRDIGLGAGGAGVGALESERADIMRGGAAGQLALAQQRIGSDISKLAMQDVKDEAQREIAGFERALGLEREIGQLGRTGFEESLERAELARAVGERERAFEQDKIGAQQAFLQETDPVRETERYLAAVAGTPLRGTQIYQPQSTMQSVLGGITAMSGFANQGGGISSLAAGGIFGEEEEDEIKDIEAFEKEADKIADKNNSKAEKEAKLKKGLKGLVESDIGESGNTFMGRMMGEERRIANQRAALERMRRNAGMFQVGGNVGKPGYNRRATGVDSSRNKKGILSGIIEGVSEGYQALKNIKFDAETESLGKYDPFTGMSPQERVRIGLAMIGQMPELGQGPLSAAAAGATPVLEQIRAEELTEADIARKRAADKAAAIPEPEILPSAVFRNIQGQVGVLYGAKVVKDDAGNVIGVDQEGLDNEAQERLAIDTKKAIETMEQAIKKDPTTAYSSTIDYITKNLGPSK